MSLKMCLDPIPQYKETRGTNRVLSYVILKIRINVTFKIVKLNK